MPEEIDNVNEEVKTEKNPNAPPAYFLSLEIKNFRCFKDKQPLDLSDGNGKPAMWTVLLGENGVGKTTLLQALSLLQPILVDENDTFQPRPEQVSFIPLGAKSLIDSLDIHWGTTVGIGTHIDANLYVPSGQNGKTDKTFLTKNVLLSPQVIGTQFSIHTTEMNLYCCAYGGLRRISSEYSYSTHTSRIAHISTLFTDRQTLVDPQRWLLNEHHVQKITSDNNSENRLDRIKKALKNLLPEEIEDFRFTVVYNNPIVEAKMAHDWINIRNLSLGYQSTIAWIIDFAYRLFTRYPNSPNPLAEPAICLVDEIDLHMHPSWQLKLIKMLSETFPKTQFIVTAHSPLIIQAAPNANLALLRRVKGEKEGEDYVEIVNDVDEIRKWRVDQILESELFGVSAYPEEETRILDRRAELIQKLDRKKEEDIELEKLNKKARNISTADTPADILAMQFLREYAEEKNAKQNK
jgi:predicted ATP-binding protein involved in virulence